jgi:tRNA modification GTPase
MFDDTLAAIATPPGHGAIAIVRLSGKDAWRIAGQLVRTRRPPQHWRPGQCVHGWVEGLDEVLVLPFAGPRSATGEDVIEIHTHGSPWVCRRVLDLCLQHGARLAEPGEYTRRAFLLGKMDLSQAESVLDLICAQGDAMAEAATANLRYRTFGRHVETLQTALRQLQAQVVASIDFPDEVDEPPRQTLAQTLAQLRQQVAALLAASRRSQWVRQGCPVAVLGRPNAGKSSLFNALLTADRAIVSEIPGTTRDVLTEVLVLAGVPITLLDTAGIRPTAERIEQLGIARSWEAARHAALILYLLDVTTCMVDGQLPEEDSRLLAELPADVPVLRLANKIDLPHPAGGVPDGWLPVSMHTGAGMTQVLGWLEAQVGQVLQAEWAQAQWVLTQRQLHCLEALATHLDEASHISQQPSLPLDVLSVPVSDALRVLGQLLGQDATEAVLTEVFQQFCVGK